MTRFVLILSLIFAFFPGNLSFSQQAAYEYLSPLPGSQFNPTRTKITVRYGGQVDPVTLSSAYFQVKGALSGSHPGKIVLARDQKTVIFAPEIPFTPGETVDVVITGGIKSISRASFGTVNYSFQVTSREFSVAERASLLDAISDEKPPANTPSSVTPSAIPFNYVTLPSDFPPFSIPSPALNTGNGYIFLSSFEGATSPLHSQYMFILDNSGEPVYYQRTWDIASTVPFTDWTLDFKKQPTGVLTYFDYSTNTFIALNSQYQLVNTYAAGNGYIIDQHDLKLFADGTAWLMIYDYQPVDMTAFGGMANATVIGLVLQQLDEDKNVIWQWRNWDHLADIPYTDSYWSLTTPTIDYIHGNSIERDSNGDILISNRHLSNIIKINYPEGDVKWRLGGKSSDFTFCKHSENTQVCHPSEVPDERFSYQHDGRWLSNGHLTLFDNGNDHTPPYSRAVEYLLDETNMKAENVWEYRNTPDTFGMFMGNAQRLPNGNTFISWGGASMLSGNPTLTEVHPDGSKAFELALDVPVISYRAFRFPWHATPYWTPTLVVHDQDNQIKLYYSWNGATEVNEYRVYGGDGPTPTTLLATQGKTGFENSTILQGTDTRFCYFQVMPVDKLGREMLASQVVINPRCANHPQYLPVIQQ